ncbi:hypothetical protein IR010_16910 [Flavobacterium sp. MR2016-29]|uniref:tetratricopeptide repeat protein n=1 Tax=Flavobacterium sp. MR2016-29 TaxID=2783795 RepID=UPI00188D34CD|nr:hypothetical protein [Flavobacterium sp. MR2016-29]MBF4494232.1 hypothetical protein [Flavobacterium sp. MR2016-29]
MKLTTILFFVILLSISKSQAKVKLQANYENSHSERLDTIHDWFNLKKKNTANLIKGKNPDIVLNFYEYYLKEKDRSRADSLVSNILKSTNEVSYRYKISLVSYKYTYDTKTHLLFLLDTNRVKQYRTYFLKSSISSLKSNGDFRAHYLDLVALDSAFYKSTPDSLVKIQMGHHYNSLAWYSILTQKLNDVEYYLKQSIKYDPTSKYPYSNMPLFLLLKGRYEEAKVLYTKLRDEPFDGPDSTFKTEFLEDFRLL